MRNKEIVIVLHGISEHSKRYENLLEYFKNNGYDAVALDYLEEQEKGILDIKVNFDDFLAPLHKYINEVSKNYEKVHIIGHSFGSNVALRLAIDNKNIKSLILTGLPMQDNMSICIGQKITNFEMKLNHKVSILNNEFKRYDKKFKNEKKNAWLNRNRKEIEKYESDPLCGAQLSPRYFNYLLKNMAYIRKNISNLSQRLDLLILVGTNDPVVNIEKLKKLVNKLDMNKSKVRLINVLEARHELFFEYNKDEIYKKVLDWIKNEAK